MNAPLWSVFIDACLINNFVLAYFLGICPFLGVSGKVARVLAWRESRDLDRAAAAADADPRAFDDALLEATLEMIRAEMGEEAAAEHRARVEARDSGRHAVEAP